MSLMNAGLALVALVGTAVAAAAVPQDGPERTEAVFDRAASTLTVVTRSSGSDPRVTYPACWFPGAQVAPLKLARGEALRLRVYLDRSVLETFANGRQCITQRIYPTRPDSLGVAFLTRGGTARIRTPDAWDMGPTNSE